MTAPKTAAAPPKTAAAPRKAAPRKPAARSTIAKAAASGKRIDLLVAMRDLIAGDLDAGVPAREVASLTRRLLEITKEIEAIHAADSGDAVGKAAATPDAAWAA